MGTRRSRHNKGRKLRSARDLYDADARSIERAERKVANDTLNSSEPPRRRPAPLGPPSKPFTVAPEPKKPERTPLPPRTYSTENYTMSRRHEAPTFDLSAARGRWIPLSSIQKMSEEDATEAFIHLRWKEGVICPHCAWYKCYQFKTRKIFKCGKCARQFSATTQTFFNSRKLPFKTILLALATLKQGSNAHRLHFDIGTTYKTALSIVHRIKARIDLPPAPYLQRHSVKDTHYPYIIGPVDDGAKLLIMVNEVVPRNIPEQIRSEVCQDLIVAILGGEIEIGDLAKKASVYIRRAFNLFPIRYGNLSLDEPAPWMRDSDRTLLEMLDSEVEHW